MITATKSVMALTGNDAVAMAMGQIEPDVVPAYPITPQTELMHKFADFVAEIRGGAVIEVFLEDDRRPFRFFLYVEAGGISGSGCGAVKGGLRLQR